MELRKITESEAYSAQDLGPFITGFVRTNAKKELYISIIGMVIILLSFESLCYWLILSIGSDTRRSETNLWEAHPVLLICSFVIIFIVFSSVFLSVTISNERNFPKGQLVYEQGVIWLTENKYSKELVEKCRVKFDDVIKVTCRKIEVDAKGFYLSTAYTLTLWGKNNSILFSYHGSYNNENERIGRGGYEYEFIDSLLTHWAEIEYNRIMASTGYFKFMLFMNNPIIIKPGMMENNEWSITAEELRYKFKKGKLMINRRFKDTGQFSKKDFSFNFLPMEDGYFFLYVLEKCMGIKRI